MSITAFMKWHQSGVLLICIVRCGSFPWLEITVILGMQCRRWKDLYKVLWCGKMASVHRPVELSQFPVLWMQAVIWLLSRPSAFILILVKTLSGKAVKRNVSSKCWCTCVTALSKKKLHLWLLVKQTTKTSLCTAPHWSICKHNKNVSNKNLEVTRKRLRWCASAKKVIFNEWAQEMMMHQWDTLWGKTLRKLKPLFSPLLGGIYHLSFQEEQRLAPLSGVATLWETVIHRC